MLLLFLSFLLFFSSCLLYADDTSGSLRGIGAGQRETHARQPTTVCWRASLSFFLSRLSLLMDIFMFAVVVSICCYAGWGFRLSWPPLLGQKSLVVVVGSLYLLLCCWPSADECPCAVINLLPYRIFYISLALALSLSLSLVHRNTFWTSNMSRLLFVFFLIDIQRQ